MPKRLRCKICLMHQQLCICGLIAPISNVNEVIFFIHTREIRKPTNTGRLAAQVLRNSKVFLRGGLDDYVPKEAWLRGDRSPLVLFPSEDALVLTTELVRSLPYPVQLIVPDGNWKQASRIPKRQPGLNSLPRVVLPPGPVSSYRLRSEPRKPYGLATIEAVARAMGIIEGKEVEDELLRMFTIMVERTLWTKGQLHRQNVYGGLPDDVVTP